MAQVTMDSKEYLELIAAQRELEHIKKDMVDGFKFEYNEGGYNKYRCMYTHNLPDEVRDQMAEVVVKECVNNPELMEQCWEEGLTIFDTGSMILTRDWGTKDKTLVDLMEYPEFQVAFNKYVELHIDKEEE